MFKFRLFLVLLHVAVFVDQGWSNALDLKCTPNETYKDDCNTCICSSDGRTAACTLVRCVALPEVSTVGSETTTEQTHHENQPSTTEAALEHIENNNHVCTPNDIKIQECNRCRCAANGIGWFCTRRLCPGNVSNGHQKRSVQSPYDSCKPGDKWNDGCNDCFCTPTGHAACTEKFCFEQPIKVLSKRSNEAAKECTPGTTWQQDCNSCFCSDTGFAACTLKGCLTKDTLRFSTSNLRAVTMQEYRDPDFSCEPFQSFKLECNTCKCSADGKGATWCTKKGCVPAQDFSSNVE